MMSEELWKVDEFWADYFGCSPEALHDAATLVVPHAALQGYDGALAFRHGPSCIVSVPATVPEIGRDKLRGASPDRAFDAETLAKSFVVWKEWISPPAWVGICGRGDFNPTRSSVRLLTADDSHEIRELAEGCGELAWNSSEFYLRRDPTFGLFVGEELVAASGFVNLSERLAYIGVVTHPKHRGMGYAKAVASASMAFAFDHDLVPMWRTMASNKAAIGVAQSLGFRPYALTMDVPLTAPEF